MSTTSPDRGSVNPAAASRPDAPATEPRPVFILFGTALAYFFWKTGRIWTGVFVGTLLVTGMLVTSTALQSPPW